MMKAKLVEQGASYSNFYTAVYEITFTGNYLMIDTTSTGTYVYPCTSSPYRINAPAILEAEGVDSHEAALAMLGLEMVGDG